MGYELFKLATTKDTCDQATYRAKLQAIDSLHRRMSACIENTARRNADNPLGQYIEENYKAPEFE
jgi:hypothetical protein